MVSSKVKSAAGADALQNLAELQSRVAVAKRLECGSPVPLSRQRGRPAEPWKKSGLLELVLPKFRKDALRKSHLFLPSRCAMWQVSLAVEENRESPVVFQSLLELQSRVAGRDGV